MITIFYIALLAVMTSKWAKLVSIPIPNTIPLYRGVLGITLTNLYRGVLGITLSNLERCQPCGAKNGPFYTPAVKLKVMAILWCCGDSCQYM